MATTCEPIRTQLEALEEQLKNTPKYVAQGQSKQINEEWINLDSHVRRTRMSLQVCVSGDLELVTDVFRG